MKSNFYNLLHPFKGTLGQGSGSLILRGKPENCFRRAVPWCILPAIFAECFLSEFHVFGIHRFNRNIT